MSKILKELKKKDGEVAIIELNNSEFYLEEHNFSIHKILSVQQQGGLSAVINFGNTFNVDYAKSIGVNVEDILFSKAEDIHDAIKISEGLIMCGAVDMVILN